MLDSLIRNGTVIDGTGEPARVADVGIRDGRIAAVGEVNDDAEAVVDADGLMVAPGFVDVHTHYDAQLFWDPLATPSVPHGVTTVFGGNCGFTIAPLGEGSAEYLRGMLAKVEGMPLPSLEEGLPWNWESFGEYLACMEERGIAVNAGFLVGHCALRRAVMGDDAVGSAASAEHLEQLVRLLAESIEAGGIGFSSSQSYTHTDGDGEPVPSRWATEEELLALSEEAGRHPGTTLEFITDGCLKGFTDEEADLMVRMSVTARRPVNWNLLTVDHRNPERHERQLEPSERAEAAGGRIVALTMPVLVPMNMSFLTHCALHMLPGWDEVMRLPVAERIDKLRDPEMRRRLDERANSPDAGVMRRLARWEHYEIGDTVSEENRDLTGRTVAEIAAERGQEPFDALLDVVIADGLATVLWPIPADDVDEAWKVRADVWRHPHVVLGGSDAGAHLDRMMGAPYPAQFLGDCLRGRRLAPVEEAVAMLTDEPARLYGLRERGRIVEGFHADLVVFDPQHVGTTRSRKVADLPGGAERLIADPVGIEHVFVNGRPVVADGRPTGERPGTVLRSGRDTETVETPGP